MNPPRLRLLTAAPSGFTASATPLFAGFGVWTNNGPPAEIFAPAVASASSADGGRTRALFGRDTRIAGVDSLAIDPGGRFVSTSSFGVRRIAVLAPAAAFLPMLGPAAMAVRALLLALVAVRVGSGRI